MQHANWWLIVLAFVLGLGLTLALTVRRVKRAVPKIATATAETSPATTAATPGPHGPGSAHPAADGSGPEGWLVKGHVESRLYHSPESPSYVVTIAEVWFLDIEAAENAGFNRWDSGRSERDQR